MADEEFKEKLRSLSFLPTKTKGKTTVDRDSTVAVKVDTFDEKQDVTVKPKTIYGGRIQRGE